MNGTVTLLSNLKHILFAGTVILQTATGVQADGKCQNSSSGNVTILLKVSDLATKIPLTIDEGYFDQRFMPRSGNQREALGLRIDATDFSSWPREIRPHQSEGPYLKFLISTYVPLELIAQRSATMSLGYRFTDKVEWQERQGPYELKVLTAPPPVNPRKGYVSGDDDIYVSRGKAHQVTDVIICKRPGKTPFTSCNHFIEQGVEDLMLRYAPEFLPEWQRLSDDAKSFFACIRK